MGRVVARLGMAAGRPGYLLPSVMAVGVDPSQGRAYVTGALFPRWRVSMVSGAGVGAKWWVWMRDGIDCRDGLFSVWVRPPSLDGPPTGACSCGCELMFSSLAPFRAGTLARHPEIHALCIVSCLASFRKLDLECRATANLIFLQQRLALCVWETRPLGRKLSAAQLVDCLRVE
jgi:hypothetical protein